MVGSQYFGVGRITAWLTQASDEARSGLYKKVTVSIRAEDNRNENQDDFAFVYLCYPMV